MRVGLTVRFLIAVALYAAAMLAARSLFADGSASRDAVELCLALAYVVYLVDLARRAGQDGRPTP